MNALHALRMQSWLVQRVRFFTVAEASQNESNAGTVDGSRTRPKKNRAPIWRRVTTWLLVAGLIACSLKLLAEVSLWRTQVLIEARKHRRAESWLNIARVLVPVPVVGADRGELYFLSARLHRRLERFDRVSDELRLALSHGWDASAVEREQWIALAQTGRFDRMSSHLADLLTNAGSDGPEICKAYVGWLLSRFQLATAHHVIDVWQSDFADSAEPYFQRGRIYSVTQNWPGAVEQFSMALDRDGTRLDARLMRAEAQIQLVRFAEALTDLEIVLKSKPESVDAQIAQANCLANLGKADEACQKLQQMLAGNPENSEALSLLGRIEQKRGNHEKARAALEKAISIRPIDSDARYALGKTLRLLGDEDAAKEHLDFVAESTRALLKLGQLTEKLVQNPGDVELRFQVGKLTWEWRSREVGEQWLRSVLEYDAEHTGTHQILAEHYDATGNTELAEKHRKMATSGSRD